MNNVAKLGMAAAIASILVGTMAIARGAQESKPKPDTVSVDIGSARYEIPKSWKRQPTKRRMRIAVFGLPLAEGDKGQAELIVFHFGRGQGGSVKANVQRWQSQFRDRKREDKLETIEVAGMKITLLDMAGTYLFRPAPMIPKVTPRKDYRMVTAIIPVPKDGPYYFRLVGPEKSIDAQAEAFMMMVRSVHPK